MNKILITLSFVLISFFTANAQTVSSITGKWVFLEIYEKEQLDSRSIEMLTEHFSKIKLNLKKGNKYDAVVNAKESGTWELDGKTLVLNSNTSSQTKINIVSVTKKQMVVKYGQGTFVMKKK